MAFKFYIDGFLTDQPDNDTELITTIKRDGDLHALLVTQEVTLSYSANNDLDSGTISGYTYLKNAFDTGTCNEAEIIVWDEQTATETYRVYTGVVKVPSISISEGDLKLSCKIDDNSFYSYIKNNKNIKFNLYSTKTKNGETIVPPNIYEVDMFDSLTGLDLSGIGNLYRGYRLFDVMSFLVAAISDNKVSFASTLLEVDYKSLFLFDGFALREPNSQPSIAISFQECVDEIYKIKNTAFIVDQTDPENPVLRLELDSYFYMGLNVISFDDIKDIKTSVDASRIFATIKVGADYNPGGAASVYTWPSGTSYYGWKEELYAPFGQCNTDTELNLVNSWKIASNAINDQVVGMNTSHDSDIFLVECGDIDDVLFTAAAVPYPQQGGTDYYYNMGLNNVTKIQNHGGNFQAALTNTATAGTDVFRASLGSEVLLATQDVGQPQSFDPTTLYADLVPIPFANEFGGDNYDPGFNYDNIVDFIYTAPIDGDYSFLSNIHGEVSNLKSCTAGGGITIQVSQFGGGTTLVSSMFFGLILDVTIEAWTDNTFTTQIGTATQQFTIQSNGTFDYPDRTTSWISNSNDPIGLALIALMSDVAIS